MARDTKLGQEEITRDIPNVGEEALRNLDEAGIVYIGAEVNPGDILVGKVTPKGESPMTPEEKLLRAIFGEKASDVRDTSLRLPPGVAGTIVDVRVFSRRGVDKDERAMAIERAEIERLAKDRDDEKSIQERSFHSRLRERLLNRKASGGFQGVKSGTVITDEVLDQFAKATWRQIGVADDAAMAEIEALKREFDARHRAPAEALREQGREAAARRRAAARRDEDGQGLRRGEAQAAAGRQDGRPPRQQGRGLPRGADRGHAVPGGRHLGRPRAEPARRAVADECRADPGDASGLGLRQHSAARSASWWRNTAARGARAGRAAGAAARGLRRGGVRARHRADGRRPADRAVGEPEEGHPDRHAGLRRRPHVGHRGHAEPRGARHLRAGGAGRRAHGRAVRAQGDGRLHLHAEAAPPGGRQDPRALHRPLLAGHPAAAGRQGAVRRPALRRDGGVGAGSLWRRLYPAGDADGEVRRRVRPHQGLRGHRARPGQFRGGHPRDPSTCW